MLLFKFTSIHWMAKIKLRNNFIAPETKIWFILYLWFKF